MFAKTVTYNNYNGDEVKETFYFNLTEAELLEMEMSVDGGFSAILQRIIDKKEGPLIIKTFKDLIFKSYGIKSDDGRRFEKSEQISKEFSETPAYSTLFMELVTNAEAAADFVNKVLPNGSPVVNVTN